MHVEYTYFQVKAALYLKIIHVPRATFAKITALTKVLKLLRYLGL